MKKIEFKNFTFKYTSQAYPTLKNINFSINDGEKVLIIGPSGSGKSTIAQIINGIIPNTFDGERSGEVLIDGVDVFNKSIYDKSNLVSSILQDTDGQFVGLTVEEDVAFLLENDVVSKDDMKRKVVKWADILRLNNLLKQSPQELSGGQKQRVSLAGVLIDEAPILLLDEPLANLDPYTGQEAIEIIDNITKNIKCTTIIIEHRLEDVLYKDVDRIILINNNSILFNGSVNDLLHSNLLKQNGIKTPLYIDTLKYLGYDLNSISDLSSVSNLNISRRDKIINYKPIINEHKQVLLEVKNLNFAYEEELVLKDINFKIYNGEKLAIIGKNGAGKSTLGKYLCNFIKAEGEIYYNGNNIAEDSVKERGSRIGFVLQNPNQMISKHLIFDEVALGLRFRKVDENIIKVKVENVLKICDLYQFRNWPISALSYGQRKRVTIASVLVLEPEILLLDEPTAGQDEKHYREIMKFLNELNARGITIVMITHDMQLMLEYSDRVIVLSDHEIIKQASPIEVLNDEEIIEKAHLKKTNIFKLAEKLNYSANDLTYFYIKNKKKEENE